MSEKKNTVTQEQVDGIYNESKKEFKKMGSKTLVCVCTLPNGFVMVKNASCVDPENFDEKIGRDMCEERITNKIWELEGYKLQSELYEQRSK